MTPSRRGRMKHNMLVVDYGRMTTQGCPMVSKMPQLNPDTRMILDAL